MPDKLRGNGIREKILEKIREDDAIAGVGADFDLPARVTCRVSARALRENYLAIQALNPDLGMIPMVKANAYGHGMIWAARELVMQPHLYGFGVATLEEGKELREGLGLRNRRTRILVFSGATPWTEQFGQFCEAFQLSPVISSDEDWHAFYRGQWPGRVSYELKFNTGMNRLGIPYPLAQKIRSDLGKLEPEARPEGIFTHLAVSENPENPLTRDQIGRFRKIRSELEPVCPGAVFHLANSSGIWNSKHYDLAGITDLVRPGISLYGVPPWAGAPTRHLQPVMTLETRVVRVHHLKPGESIGYGATFRAKSPQTVAVLPIGYADGWHRSLSNQGYAWMPGHAERFVGVVSMDLSVITADPKTKVGDPVQLLGPNVSIWDQAKAAGTIPYELFTSISARVKRLYE